MQNGLYRNAIQAILQNHPLFLAQQGGKNRRKFSISAGNEVLKFRRQEAGDGRQTTAPAEIKNEELRMKKNGFCGCLS